MNDIYSSKERLKEKQDVNQKEKEQARSRATRRHEEKKNPKQITKNKLVHKLHNLLAAPTHTKMFAKNRTPGLNLGESTGSK